MTKATKCIYNGQIHSWGEIFYSVYNEPLDDDDSLFISEKWELGNEIEALKLYLIVKINFKELYYMPSENLVIEEEGKKEIMRLSNLLKSILENVRIKIPC